MPHLKVHRAFSDAVHLCEEAGLGFEEIQDIAQSCFAAGDDEMFGIPENERLYDAVDACYECGWTLAEIIKEVIEHPGLLTDLEQPGSEAIPALMPADLAA